MERAIRKNFKRLMSVLLAFAMVFTTVITDDVVNAYAAASSKAVKSVSLKIGKTNVTKKTKAMYVKDTATLKVTVNPSSAKNSVSYKSNKTAIATVNANGKITAKKAGTAKITVTVKGKNNKKKSTYVNVKVVNRPVTKVTLNSTAKALYKGQSAVLKATVAPSNATVKTVKWTSSNKAVATVNAAGKVTAIGVGKATITAQSGTKKAICVVTVKAIPVTKVTLNATSKSIEVGESTTLKATVVPANATVKTVKWSSSDTTVATVNAAGKVTGVSSGVATITAQSGTKKATCKIVVKEKTVDVTGVSLNKTDISVEVTATSQLVATVNPNDASDKSVQWVSSNPDVAKVNNEGIVQGISEGKAVITVTAGNGKFKATCNVTVTEDTSKNASNAKISVANSLPKYPNTVLTGTNADVKVLVTNANGAPLGNTSVTLEIDSQYGNAPSVFGITGDNNNYVSAKLTTDKDGYASFTVGERGGYSYTSTDKIYESYKLTATVTGSNVKAESTLSFACIETNDVEVLNNYFVAYPNIEPGENAEAVWPKGIAYTYSTNGAKDESYVSSQKVSTNKVDHRVYIAAAPQIILPAKNNQTKIDKYYNDNFKKSSSQYGVYNDESNENTTTLIKGVPAGLQYATLVFDKIVLSKYTTLQIKTFDATSGAEIETYIMDETNMKSDGFGYQIPIQEDTAVNVQVSLISEGQVNDDSNDGFVINHVEGLYKTQLYENSDRQELDATVTWSKSKTYYSEYKQMSYEKASSYIKDAKYLNKNYNYSYEVPVFPNTGDAVIKVTDENSKVVAYFLYPTENKWKNSDGTIYPTNTTVKNISKLTNGAGYENENDISLPSKYKAAVKASEEEVSNEVGTVTQIGNIAVVDSMYSGRTNLKATISIPGVSDIQLNPTNGSELYTSVQWAPIPEVQSEEAGDDFYAIATQLITVKAQLYDTNGNKVTLKDKDVTFKLDGQKIEKDELQTLDGNENVSIEKKDKVSNEKGQAVIQFTSGSDKGYVHHLTAECEGYNVKLLVGPNETETELANLYWVKLGLSFTDKVAYRKSVDGSVKEVVSTTTSTLNGKTEVESINSDGKLVKNVDSRKVGNNWIFGYELVGNIDYSNKVSKNVVADISNIKIILSKSDSTGMTMDTAGMPNGAAKVYTEKTGNATIVGQIGNDSFANETANNVVFTIADVDGNIIGKYSNVGENAPAVQEKLSLNMSWENKGKNVKVIYPQGNILNVSVASTAYIQVLDDYGNPVKNQEVTYSITGVNAKTDVAGVTDSDGLVKIELAAPGTSAQGSTTRISVKVDDTSYTGETLTYKRTTDTKFGLVGAQLDASNVEQPEIVLTFSGSVDRKLIKAGMFKVTSTMDGTTSYAVESARIGNDNNVVILKLKPESKNIVNDTEVVTVSVKDYEENGILYKLGDTNGRYVNTSYDSVGFTAKAKYTIEAKVNADNTKISITIKDSNGEVVTDLSKQKVKDIYSYSSVADVLNNKSGILKQSTLSDINTSPISSETTVFIYYCGASCSVSVKAQS